MTVLVLVREVGVTVLRFVVIRHGVMPAGRGGKLKTVLQTVAIVAYLLPLTGVLQTAAVVVMGAAVVLTVVTGVEIGYAALVLRTTSERADLKRQGLA